MFLSDQHKGGLRGTGPSPKSEQADTMTWHPPPPPALTGHYWSAQAHVHSMFLFTFCMALTQS